MNTKVIDARGLRCPQPELKMSIASNSMKKGDVLECLADCATFEADTRAWVQRNRKTLLSFTNEGTYQRCQVKI